MNARAAIPVRIVLTLGICESDDVRGLAGDLLGFLTSRSQVKRVEPTRIQEHIELPDGGLEWRDVEYWRREAGPHGTSTG